MIHEPARRRILLDKKHHLTVQGVACYYTLRDTLTQWQHMNRLARRLSMATVQGALLQHRDDAQAAVTALVALHDNPPPIELKARPVYAAGREALPSSVPSQS